MSTKLQNSINMIAQPTMVLLERGSRMAAQCRVTARLLEASISRFSCPELKGADQTKEMVRPTWIPHAPTPLA